MKKIERLSPLNVYPFPLKLIYSTTKTRLYSFDPLKLIFYTVKLGFTGLTEAVLTSIHNLCLVQKNENYQNFSSESFHFLAVKFSIYLNRRVFVMTLPEANLSNLNNFAVRNGKVKVKASFFWSIVYNRAIVYKRQSFLKVVVHAIITDQCNQTAC